jgi:hypothetical protein
MGCGCKKDFQPFPPYHRNPSALLSSPAGICSSGGLTASVPIASSPEERSFLLLVKPAEELPETRSGLDLFDRVEFVAQFVMRPRFVDKILAGMAGRSDVSPTFAARHYVVPSCGHLPVTKCAGLVHTVGPEFLLKDIHSCRPLKVSNPWFVMALRNQFHQLTPQRQCGVLNAKCRVAVLILHS